MAGMNCSLLSPHFLADSYKADGLKHYVDWAARQGFAVMDVNIPKFLNVSEVCDLGFVVDLRRRSFTVCQWLFG